MIKDSDGLKIPKQSHRISTTTTTSNEQPACNLHLSRSCSHNYGTDTHTLGPNPQLRLPPHHPSLKLRHQ
ncbi:hypothetical protein FHG87_025128, partial [Trinorchestia longiramus]